MTSQSKRATNKPKAASRAYRIKGTALGARKKGFRSQQQINKERRTRFCIGCTLERNTSYPFCGKCQSDNLKKRKEQ